MAELHPASYQQHPPKKTTTGYVEFTESREPGVVDYLFGTIAFDRVVSDLFFYRGRLFIDIGAQRKSDYKLSDATQVYCFRHHYHWIYSVDCACRSCSH